MNHRIAGAARRYLSRKFSGDKGRVVYPVCVEFSVYQIVTALERNDEQLSERGFRI